MRFGIWEIVLIIVLVLILFSHNKIPAMMKNVADGLKVFKKELKSEQTPAAKSTRAAKRTTTTKAAPAKTTSKKNENKGAVYLEFGAYASMAAAHAARRRLMSAHADLFADCEFVVLEQGTRNPFKLQMRFDNAAAAREFMSRADGIKCKIVA